MGRHAVRPADVPDRLPASCATTAVTPRRRCRARWSIPATSACSTGAVAVDPVRQVMFGMPTYLPFTSRLVPAADIPARGADETSGSEQGLNRNDGAPYGVVMGPFLVAARHALPGAALGLRRRGRPATPARSSGQHKNGTVRDMTPLPLPFELGVPGIGGPIITARRRRLPRRPRSTTTCAPTTSRRATSSGRRACPPAASRRR